MTTSHEETSHFGSTMVLTAHGRADFAPEPSLYVVHTSTIPLATTVDNQRLLKSGKSNTASRFHGYAAETGGANVHCPKQRCMFLHSDNTRENQRVLSNCPCGSVLTPEGEKLQPLCFLTYVKALNIHLINRMDDYDQGLKPAQIMFCHDSNGILDNSYPGILRDKLGVTSWGHVSSARKLIQAFGCLYWFRKYGPKYKISRSIESFCDLRGIAETRRVWAQVLHTLNGLLIKKFMALGPEIVGYRDLADQTARMAKELFLDYIKPAVMSAGLYIQQESVYVELKDLFNLIKQDFHKPLRFVRTHWLEKKFSNRAIGSFFGSEFRRLMGTINRYQSSENEDYTESLAWVFRCTTLCQTRTMGYLPPHIAEIKRDSYRKTVNRPLEKLEPDRAKYIYLATRKFLHHGGIKENLFNVERDQSEGMLFDAIANVSVDIKQNASVDHTVSDGGKIEDARVLINTAIKNEWKIPVRDLNDHSIIEIISVSDHDAEIESWARIIFWTSYQIVLNFWIRRGKWNTSDYHPLPVNGEDYYEDILLAKILHISEPGKERNLTKSKAVYAWFLTPAGKLCQSVLANLPEHRAGLEMAAHDWMHTRRISSESTESGFIYDPSTGKLRTEIIHAFKDWTESTDFISKFVGLSHLTALLDFTGFPVKYGELLKRTILAPQPVEEVAIRKIGSFDLGEKFDETTYATWSGAIREGYMMGNPITKSILHLIHVSELQTVKEYLSKRGIRLERGAPLSESLDRPKIKRLTEEGALVREWRPPRLPPFIKSRHY